MNNFFLKVESLGYRSYFVGFNNLAHLHFHFKEKELLSIDIWIRHWICVLWDNFDGIFELREVI